MRDMSQGPLHFRIGYQLCADCGDHHRDQTDQPSAFVPGQTDGDSVVQLLSHAPSSGTVELELMQTGPEGRKLDYSCDPAHGNPRSEADPEPSVLGTSEKERSLRRKPKCEDLRAKAAYQAMMEESAQAAFPVFESPKLHALGTSLPQERSDSPACILPELPEHERDPKDGRRTRRGHRPTERPLSPSPSLKTLKDPQVEIEPRSASNHGPRCAGNMSQQSNSRPDAQAESHVQAQGAGFLTSQEWQQHPTTHGPGSPYEIARTLREKMERQKPSLHAEEETHSNASTLIGETRFNPIAGLEGFDDVLIIHGEGYHYPQILCHLSTPSQKGPKLEVAAIKDVPYKSASAEETILKNVPAYILRAGNVARVKRGYPALDPSRSASSSDYDAQQEYLRVRVVRRRP